MHDAQGGCCAKCRKEITVHGCIGEHIVPVALGNEGKPDCLLCLACADTKTNGSKATSYGSDKHAIAKAKRLAKARKALGGAETGKAKAKGRPLPGTKASGLRKRMNGNVERWEE